MILKKHDHLGRRIIQFITLMFVLISFTFISTHHVEVRSVVKETSQVLSDYKLKSFVKPRPAASILRVGLTPELVAFVIFLIKQVFVPLLTTPIYKRFSIISTLIKRLFLMPIKLTSTSIV